jgi:hypothetical protein
MNGVFQILLRRYVDSWKSSTFAIDFGNSFEMNRCSWLAKLSTNNSNSSGVGNGALEPSKGVVLSFLAWSLCVYLQIDGIFFCILILITISNHYYKMWVQFISPCSLDQWIHCFFINPRSLQPMNSLKIQWNWRTRTPFVVVNYMHFTFYCAWSMTHVITSHIHLPISNWTSL